MSDIVRDVDLEEALRVAEVIVTLDPDKLEGAICTKVAVSPLTVFYQNDTIMTVVATEYHRRLGCPRTIESMRQLGDLAVAFFSLGYAYCLKDNQQETKQ